MKCPKCNQPPMSFSKFVFSFKSFKKIKCSNCGTELRKGKSLRIMNYVGFVIGIIIGYSESRLRHIYNWDLATSISILVVIVVIYVIAIIFVEWKFGRYEVEGDPGK